MCLLGITEGMAIHKDLLPLRFCNKMLFKYISILEKFYKLKRKLEYMDDRSAESHLQHCVPLLIFQ